MSVVWFDMCEKPLPARRVHDHGHALKISSYGSAAGERKCFIKSKSSNEMILRPGVVNLKIHPTWTWGEWDPHLFLPWDQTLCRAEVWPPEAIIDVPTFLPYLKLFLEKSFNRDIKEILWTVGLVRQDEEGHCSPGLGCRSGKPFEHFFKNDIYAVKALMRTTGKTSIFYFTSGASTSLCKRYSTISKLPAHKILRMKTISTIIIETIMPLLISPLLQAMWNGFWSCSFFIRSSWKWASACIILSVFQTGLWSWI